MPYSNKYISKIYLIVFYKSLFINGNPLFPLLLALLLILMLGREQENQKNRLSKLIPSLIFFKVSIISGLVASIISLFKVDIFFSTWINITSYLSLCLGCTDVGLDISWNILERINKNHKTPPKILKDIIFLIISFTIIGLELNTRGILNTIGTAAILTGLAFIISPGSSSVLKNISSALVVQVERQFKIGDWIEIDGIVGRVDNISWNSTYLYNDMKGCYMVLPNYRIDINKIVNFSRSPNNSIDYKMEIKIGLPYQMPPDIAFNLLAKSMQGHPDVPDEDRTRIFLDSYGESTINYIIRFYIYDFLIRRRVKSSIHSRIWYQVEKAGYSMPFPTIDIKDENSNRNDKSQIKKLMIEQNYNVLRKVELFEPLMDQDLELIASKSRVLTFSPDERIIRKNDIGKSMFVIIKGECLVILSDDKNTKKGQLSHLKEGDIFGEISALTDAKRTSTVISKNYLSAIEIKQDQITKIFIENKDTMNRFATLIASREAEIKELNEIQRKSYELSLLDKIRNNVNNFFS